MYELGLLIRSGPTRLGKTGTHHAMIVRLGSDQATPSASLRVRPLVRRVLVSYLRLIRRSAEVGTEDASTELIECILADDNCDVDSLDNQGATPLHYAVRIVDPESRSVMIWALLNAGADMTCVSGIWLEVQSSYPPTGSKINKVLSR